MEVTVTVGRKNFYFESIERVKECPRCKKEYRSRKFCLSCSKGRKVYQPVLGDNILLQK